MSAYFQYNREGSIYSRTQPICLVPFATPANQLWWGMNSHTQHKHNIHTYVHMYICMCYTEMTESMYVSDGNKLLASVETLM